MERRDGELLLSATDLVDFLECEHLTHLDLEVANGRLDLAPTRTDSTDLIAAKGVEHEERHLRSLREGGATVVDVTRSDGRGDTRDAVARTRDALRSGASVIYQAALARGRWRGHADFLERVERPSDLGGWSYEVVDTKLARSLRPHFVLQLCLYSELLADLQGRVPESLHIVLGSGDRRSLRVADFAAYHRRLRRELAEALERGVAGTYPEPVEHCPLCRWSDHCDEVREGDDHLSLVARMGRPQIARLREVGIDTVAALAESSADDRPGRIGEPTFERLRAQARLQVSQRTSGRPSYELLEPEEGRGFALLPPPSEGDLFFDIEGDPFYEDGLEYLFGVTTVEARHPGFRAFWGPDRAREKAAFEALIDFLMARLERFPDMHVYHYAAYEPTALKRLMGLHATREEEVDHLLRNRRLVDLYRVVEQGLRISQSSYSIKKVEAFYLPEAREAAVTEGGDSIVQFERWLESGDPELLESIERYNEEDCRSTHLLREWLLERREEASRLHATTIPFRGVGEADPAPIVAEEDKEVAALQRELWAGLPAEPAEFSAEERSRRLMGQLLDYHRREDKPVWWSLFERLDLSEQELISREAEAIGGLEPAGELEPLGGRSQSFRRRMSFPRQEHKVAPGEYLDPFTVERDDDGSPDPFSPCEWEVLAVHEGEGTLDLKVGPSRREWDPPRALIPCGPYWTTDQRAALRELAATVIAEDVAGGSRHRAALDLLARALPRSTAVSAGRGLQEGEHDLGRTLEIARGLDRSHLFIQGPPGAGKTYAGARLVVDLLGRGHRIGVTAPSHKAINNLLHEVEACAPADASWRGLKKSSESDQAFVSRLEEPLIEDERRSGAFPTDPEIALMAGTAWLWCREDVRSEGVDDLVIDEAGQVSLADALAMATAARNVVLLGDPLQLAHVSQAVHPDGVGSSILEHLLAGDGTVAPERGIFLDRSRRMHPDVCRFISAAVYEDRLSSIEECRTQRIDSSEGGLSGTGVRAVMVKHEGNARHSVEEAEAIAREIERLGGALFTRSDGTSRPLEYSDLMVVTPYNAQVRCLRSHLPAGVQVGTVDKFQGQEAAIVFFSMATSSSEEIPRNVEFLYSRNRLNVAVSRARCLAVLVASPRLLTIRCRSVEQMRLANALCLLAEMAEGAPDGPPTAALATLD